MMILGWASGAHAEAAEQSDTQLQEVVVTAQRRTERLQDVPIAVNVLTADQAQKIGVTDPVTLGSVVPGIRMGRQGFAATTYVRGVGATGGNVGQEPPVATYVDDVYVPHGSAALFNYNNINAIEVLKGPQGTLFGRNATGGVIHVRTLEPTAEPTLKATATYGNYDLVQTQVYGSMGLADNVAANVAAYYLNQSDGWGRNIVTGNDAFDNKGQGIRGKLLWDITPQASWTLSASYDYRRTTQGVATRVLPGLFSRNGFQPEAAGAGFYDSTTDNDRPIHTRFSTFSSRLRYDLGPVRVFAVTAYSRIRSTTFNDIDTTPAFFSNSDAFYRGDTFTQELQLLSPDGAKIQWIVGGFYLRDKSSVDNISTGTSVPAPGFAQGVANTSSYSAFGQATTEVMPNLNVTAGLRYTSDERRFVGAARRAAVRTGPFKDQETFGQLTGRFSVDYKVTPDVMIYAAYNRGFKSGVYNMLVIQPGVTTPPTPVKPEEINAYSAGFKSEFADHRVRLNAEAYYYDYKNIQVFNRLANASVLTNGGAATIKGIEGELEFLVTENLRLTAGVSIADGKYDSFKNGLQFLPLPPNTPIPIPRGCAITTYPAAGGGAPAAVVGCDLSGNKTVQTVPLSTNIAATYTLPTEMGDFDFTLSWSHGGDFYWEADNDPASLQPKVDVVNGSIRWLAPDEKWSVLLWGRNLFKEKYSGYTTNGNAAFVKYSPEEPRVYGVTLGVNF
jgi:iron complex outermembrane receptor protein